MKFNFIRKLPTPKELKEIYPLDEKLSIIKKSRDKEIMDILTNESKKLLIIVGPCSAHEETSVLDYCHRLSVLQNKVKNKCLLVPRIYTNKPRTNAEGYKGLLHQPNPNDEPNILDGIVAIRNLHMKVLSECNLSTADELLYPENFRYINDLLSYVAVGARSVENQFHRLAASGVGIACGMKNPTFGSLQVMLNSIFAAQNKHTFIYRNWEVTTPGNPYCHAILRGYTDDNFNNFPNYHYEDIKKLYDLYISMKLSNPSVIIDTNHSNSGKKFIEQIRIAKEVLDTKRAFPALYSIVKGFMIESFIEEGCQNSDEHIYGKSITDPCLSWKDTEELILYISEQLC